MILACEARKKAQEIVFQHQTDELIKADSHIREAVIRGEMSCTFTGKISEQTRKELERCGYKINTGMQYNEGYVSIKW